jgi:hypothetical protein
MPEELKPLQTFTFESQYPEDDGLRADIVLAPDRDTARRLAAVETLEDNDWTLAGQGCDSLLSFYDGSHFDEGHKMDVEAEWGDLGGTACPNCTSHGGRPNGNLLIDHDGNDLPIHVCAACGYSWAPLGFDKTARQLLEDDARNSIAALDEYERASLQDDEEEEEVACPST